MTRAVIWLGPDGYEGFSMKGHSGYDVTGSDIVCAGASMLATTCVNALESVAGIIPKVIQKEDPVSLEVYLPAGLPPQRLHDGQVILGALRQGLSDLSHAYPKHMHLSIQERRNHSC